MTIASIMFKAAGECCGSGALLFGSNMLRTIIPGALLFGSNMLRTIIPDDKKDGSTWVKGGSQSVDEDEGEAEDQNQQASDEGKTFQYPYSCPHCCKKFDTEEALQGHDTCFAQPCDIDDAAKSGNGEIAAVGFKLEGTVQCAECNQKFDTENALSLHCRFIHANLEFSQGYELRYEFKDVKQIDGVGKSCEESSTEAMKKTPSFAAEEVDEKMIGA